MVSFRGQLINRPFDTVFLGFTTALCSESDGGGGGQPQSVDAYAVLE